MSCSWHRRGRRCHRLHSGSSTWALRQHAPTRRSWTRMEIMALPSRYYLQLIDRLRRHHCHHACCWARRQQALSPPRRAHHRRGGETHQQLRELRRANAEILRLRREAIATGRHRGIPQTTCAVCLEAPASTVFLPCGPCVHVRTVRDNLGRAARRHVVDDGFWIRSLPALPCGHRIAIASTWRRHRRRSTHQHQQRQRRRHRRASSALRLGRRRR